MTGNTSSSYEGKTSQNTVIEYVEDYVEEPPYSDFAKAVAGVFDKIDNGKADVLLL